MVFVLLSPAKTMDFTQRRTGLTSTQPHFRKQAHDLVKVLAALTPAKIGALMHISPKLSALNHTRFQEFITGSTAKKTPDEAQFAMAVLAYQGDTYQGLNARDLSDKDLQWAQDHVGMLTGLYGVLQPLDLIQPYRLEMGTALAVGARKNLYAYWGNALTNHVNALVADKKLKAVIGCASNEYLKALDTDALSVPFIQCEFKEIKNGKPTVVGLFAKRARGAMARYVIAHRITDPKKLKNFDSMGYAFDPALSTDTQFVFTR